VVNGAAAGIAVSLALACNLAVAAESAYVLLWFTNIGLIPDGGSSLRVPSRVGNRERGPAYSCLTSRSSRTRVPRKSEMRSEPSGR
jgi:enoyl-CoA hydratase/carnithine racemase